MLGLRVFPPFLIVLV